MVLGAIRLTVFVALVAPLALLASAVGWVGLPELLLIFALAGLGAFFAGRFVRARVELPRFRASSR